MDRNGATHGQRVQVSRHAGWYSSTAVTLAGLRSQRLRQRLCGTVQYTQTDSIRMLHSHSPYVQVGQCLASQRGISRC